MEFLGKFVAPAAGWAFLALFLAPFLAPLPGRAEEDPFPKDEKGDKESKVLYVPVEGDISPAAAESIQKKIREWLERDPAIHFVVFEINSTGGDDDAAHALAEFIFQQFKGKKTIAFIKPGGEALAQGALIALAANKVVMGKGSRLGAAGPEETKGLLVAWDKAAKERQAEIRGWFANYAAGRGYPRAFTDAFVSREHDDVLEVLINRPQGKSQLRDKRFMTRGDFESLPPEKKTPLREHGEPQSVLRKGDLLVMNEEQAREYGFVENVAQDRSSLQLALGIIVGPENMIDVQSGAMKMRYPAGQAFVDVCNQPFVRLLLLLGGCLGILLEIKMFGTFLPGLFGLTCFAVFFITSLLPAFDSALGTATVWEVLLFVLGLGLITVEVVAPGFAIFALSGGALCLVSIVLAMLPEETLPATNQMDLESAITVLVLGFGGSALVFLALLRFLPRSSIFLGKGLVSHEAIVGVPTADSALQAQAEMSAILGKTGLVVTSLRPAGKVELEDGQLLDVVAEGEFVEKGSRVRVSDCTGGRIVVVRAPKE